MKKTSLLFLKLGGSLITQKSHPHTPRVQTIRRLAREIKTALLEDPKIRLVLGHGSGSFGHVPASKYKTIEGVHSIEEWHGFLEVWREARELNQIVLRIFAQEGLPVLAFAPSAGISCSNRKIFSWDVDPIKNAMGNSLIPLIYGDVVFDQARGGTILSTEDLFIHLTRILKPERILLAGEEDGVWRNYPQTNDLVKRITPENFHHYASAAGKSKGLDVTGGMAQKVGLMVDLVSQESDLVVEIFSGKVRGNLQNHLLGGGKGTIISK